MINEVNGWLENIFEYLEEDLSALEVEIKERLYSVTDNKIDLDNVFNYFFGIRGKRLRPILVILSAGIIKADTISKREVVNDEIKLAAALELIHNSSLIHDDIVDESTHRRGQVTMNQKFNNRIAVLAGDLLFSHAFLIMNKLGIPRISEILSECVEKMCQSEINEIMSPCINLKQYIAHLEAKTASLMSTSCKCGAIISGANEVAATALGDFGTNFGIAYQLIDDFLDNDYPKEFPIDLISQANTYAKKAINCLAKFPNSQYKDHLINLVKYVIQKPDEK